MDKHTFKVLEYEQVREIIARKTTSVYGREYVENRMPLRNPEEIKALQSETLEATRILESTDPFTVGELKESRNLLDLATKNVALQPSEILSVYDIAVRSRLLKKYLSNRQAIMPRLHEKSVGLETFQELETSVKKAIGPEGLILDSASSDLSEIRRKMSVTNGRVQGQLEQFLRNPDYVKMLQEPIITRREHRYVLPVKHECRGSFPGLALDTSASGATVFMEPLSVLKLTNELKYLESEEKREEEQIRLKISQKIAKASEGLNGNLEFLGHFDALQAAARFMADTNGSLPAIIDKPDIYLRNARHPLLSSRAVPIDVHVGKKFRGLIVTGPNTGGKTVTLKTVGLLTLLALSGFPIPADPDSEVGIFTGIFADIGDEQSISQNLSTFSAHMTNIVQILPRSGRKTLILLDEIGAGTDPTEGVALASGILNYLINRGSRVIATTHYNELKVFASNNENFANAAVEFDETTLEPTYRINIGLPGRSCALKIGERLGLPKEVIEESKSLMGSGHFQLEALLSDIDREKTIAQKERIDAEENREKMEKLKEEYDRKLSDISKEREEIYEKAIKDADELLQSLSAELSDARKEWRKSLKDYQEGKKSRQEIRDDEKKTKSRLDEAINRLKSLQKKNEPKKETLSVNPASLNEGDAVHITRMGRRGKIAELLGNDMVLVQLGNIKMEIPIRDIEPVDIDFSTEPEPVAEMRVRKALTITDRLDIRGMRADEGIEALIKFIDDASLANLNSFQIVHGKGTGALREAIHDYLRRSGRIKSFRDGEMHEGGWGVTVITL